jgi:hypothetical protein
VAAENRRRREPEARAPLTARRPPAEGPRVGALARLLFILLLLAPVSFGAERPVTDYEVKAAFLYSFAKYVQWPADLADPSFVITVLGDDPFQGVLDDALRGKQADSRRVVLKRTRHPEEVGRSQILFISDSEERELPRILKTLEGSPVLTVGEMDRFAERGGAIRFRMDQNRVRLDVNLKVAEQAHLRISSELLKLARIVSHEGGAE